MSEKTDSDPLFILRHSPILHLISGGSTHMCRLRQACSRSKKNPLHESCMVEKKQWATCEKKPGENRRRQRRSAALFHYHIEHMRRRESTRPAVHSIMAQIGGNGFWNYIFRASHCARAARGFPFIFCEAGPSVASITRRAASLYILTSTDETNRTGLDEQIVCLELRRASSINIYKSLPAAAF